MKIVKPKVWLVMKPEVLVPEMRDYLQEVGGESWLDRVLESGIEDGDLLTEFGGRLCYRSWEPGLNPNVTRVRTDSLEYVRNILSSGHGSVTEHPSFTFVLHNVSRVLTHEIVRHRAGVAISQESMRFVRLDDLPFWFPDWALEDEEFMKKALDELYRAEAFQLWMADYFKLNDPGVPFSEKKHKTSFMRRFAPSGHATGIMLTINVRALRHIIYMRTALGAEEEIRLVCDMIANRVLDEIPYLMSDYSPNEDREWIPTWMKV